MKTKTKRERIWGRPRLLLSLSLHCFFLTIGISVATAKKSTSADTTWYSPFLCLAISLLFRSFFLAWFSWSGRLRRRRHRFWSTLLFLPMIHGVHGYDYAFFMWNDVQLYVYADVLVLMVFAVLDPSASVITVSLCSSGVRRKKPCNCHKLKPFLDLDFLFYCDLHYFCLIWCNCFFCSEFGCLGL